MNVELREIHPKNFRCFDDRTFSFGHNTVVRGTNGAGKSTLFDAFTFTLFGKDSNGRTDFGYKRRDSSGAIIHELEYGCEVTFDVDGVIKRFERIVQEKWTKSRKKPVLTGNECAYYVDRVRCATKKEYDTAVAAIVGEDVFRIMTDVYFFMSQKDDYKKSMLLKMAYGTSDTNEADKLVVNDVLQSSPQFADFIAKLNGTSVKDFNANVGEKIKAIKEELDEVPIRIAAKKESMPPEEDWEALKELIEVNKECLADIDKQIADENARQSGVTEKNNKLRTDKSNLEYELLQRENAIRSDVSNRESATRQKIADIDVCIRSETGEREQFNKRLTADKAMVATLEKQLEEKRNQFRSIKDGTYQFSEAELYCPTCGHPYDKEKLTEQKIKENKNQGQAIRAEYDRYIQEVSVLEQKVSQSDEAIANLQQQKSQINFQPIDVNKLISADQTCITIKTQIETIKAQIEASQAPQTTSDLYAIKREAETKMSGFLQRLGTKDVIARIQQQVLELQNKQAALNNELAELEMLQDEAKEFQKAKDRQLLERINGMFTIVSWDFVSEQYNGNDRIACNCYVGGMPYAERNHAGQVNAGLDIINALARTQGVHLPIFIDNAESVVKYIPTDSQLILLSVDGTAKELIIETK